MSADILATLRSTLGRHLRSAIAVGLIVIAWLLCNRLLPDHPIEPGEDRRIVVLPFDFHGPPSEAYLGEGVASLLSTALDGVDSLKSIEPRYLMTVARRKHLDVGDSHHPGRLAHAVRAGFVVTGDLVVTGNRARVTTRLTRILRNGSRSESGPVAESSLDSLTELSDQVARDLVVTHLGGAGDGLATAARTTSSARALRSYLVAQHELAHGNNLPLAASSLRDAVNADSGFALAWDRLAAIQARQLRFNECRASISHAAEKPDRLAPRDRLSIEASRAYYFGEWADCERLTRQLQWESWDDPEQWTRLATTLVVSNSLRERSIVEAVWPFKRAAALGVDRRDLVALQLNSLLAAREPLLIQDLLSKDSTGVDVEDGLPMRSIIRRIFLRDQKSADALVSMKGSLGYSQLMHAAYWLKSGKDTKLALEFAREAASPRFTADERAAALAHVALLSIARGQKRSATEALRQARGLRPVEGAAYAAVVGLSAGALADEGSLREDLEAVDGLPRLHDPLVSEEVDTDAAGTEGSIALARLALRAQILARLGLIAGVESACRELETFSGTDLEERWAKYYATAARAALAWNRSDPRATLEQLEKAPLVAQPSARKALRSNQNERFLRGEALRALARDTDALAWYRGLNEFFWWDTSYATIAALRCAELDEKQGHPDSAIRYYREALDNLADCDPEYLPWRALAESGTKRLAAVSKARP